MEGQSKYRKIINEIGKEKIILLSLAVLLLLFCQIPWGKNKKNTVEPNTKEKVAQNTELSECQLEERLEKTLSNMEGAGKTKVLITFQSSAENIIKEEVVNYKVPLYKVFYDLQLIFLLIIISIQK